LDGLPHFVKLVQESSVERLELFIQETLQLVEFCLFKFGQFTPGAPANQFEASPVKLTPIPIHPDTWHRAIQNGRSQHLDRDPSISRLSLQTAGEVVICIPPLSRTPIQLVDFFPVGSYNSNKSVGNKSVSESTRCIDETGQAENGLWELGGW
jgi:hypothetical protein